MKSAACAYTEFVMPLHLQRSWELEEAASCRAAAKPVYLALVRRSCCGRTVRGDVLQVEANAARCLAEAPWVLRLLPCMLP